MTAIDSSRIRTPDGRPDPAMASTPSAKAMSVATGIAHAPPSAASPPETAIATRAGTTMPPAGREQRQGGGLHAGQLAHATARASPPSRPRRRRRPAGRRPPSRQARGPGEATRARSRARYSRSPGRRLRRRLPRAGPPRWRAGAAARRSSPGAGTQPAIPPGHRAFAVTESARAWWLGEPRQTSRFADMRPDTRVHHPDDPRHRRPGARRTYPQAAALACGARARPDPGPFDEAVQLLIAPVLLMFYRRPMRDAWRGAMR